MEEDRKKENKQELFRNVGLILLVLIVFAGTRFWHQWLVNGSNRIFEEYNGPVMPLSVMSDATGIEAERNVVLDFSAYENVVKYPDTAVRKITVIDGYQLTNRTGEDITIKAVYPFTGRLTDELAMMPVLSVNGEAVEASLTVGREHMRYVEMHKENGDTDANDLYGMNGRNTYISLLSDGSYREDAFETAPGDNLPVKVYCLKKLAYDGEYKDEMLPMVKVAYERDKEKTAVITYGARIYGSDDTTRYEYYNLPQRGESGFEEDAYMIVLGEDISNLELQYWDQRHGELLEGVSVEVEEYVSTLGEMIDQLVVKKRDAISEKDWILSEVSDEELKADYIQYFYDAGVLEEDTLVGLEDLHYLCSDRRVMYLAFEIEIPAGKMVEITASFDRMEDLVDAGGTECGGYDIVTTLDSNFTFTKQTIELINTEYATFVDAKGAVLETDMEEMELNMQEDGFELLLAK